MASGRRKPPDNDRFWKPRSTIIHTTSIRLLLRICCCLLVSCVLPVGCSGEKSASVRGKVTLDGEPVAAGNIAFLPTAAGGKKAAAAIEQGAYAIPASEKLLPGSYRVEISWHKPTGRKIASADPGMTIDETREAVPAKYNSNSTLTVEIGSGEVEQDFALSSR
jgi:hypothetical protein